MTWQMKNEKLVQVINVWKIYENNMDGKLCKIYVWKFSKKLFLINLLRFKLD